MKPIDKKNFSIPFQEIDENLEWLELDNIPEVVPNVFENYPIGSARPDITEELLNVFTNVDYLHFTTKMLLGVELPPYQAAILDVLWRKKLPMLIASRGAAKSFTLAVYALLRMVFHQGCRIVIVGSGLRQARQVFDYMANIWENAPILRDIAGKGQTVGPRREVDRFQFQIGDSYCYAIPLGDGMKIRGLRANYIIADEFASIGEEIFNLVVQGFAIVAPRVVDKIKEAALIKKLRSMGRWTDEMDKIRMAKAGGNQIIYSGTAFYSFNHFYKYFNKWHTIISSQGDLTKLKDLFDNDEFAAKGFNWRDYAIIRLPYTHVPEGMLEPHVLAQAKATLSHNQFLMEYAATFASDSDGFYKRSILESATTNKPILVSSGEMVQFNVMREGSKDKAYVIGVDPAADRDNAAIVVLEQYQDHRRIVHCWTTNKKKHTELKKYYAKQNIPLEDDYYRFIARKIRKLMQVFNTERIIMDKNGGGTAIAEALASQEACNTGEHPVYLLINTDEPKPDDMKQGLHILELIAPTNDINSEANHGMLKDFQDKVLLFPLFDSIELAKAIEIDNQNDLQFDTFEDLVQEIEELKREITSITVTPSSSLGKETFDTPSIKGEHDRKGRLRKDRYSALLYANYYSRNKDKNTVMKIEYRAFGGTKDTIKKEVTIQRSGVGMYYGPGVLKFGQSKWLSMCGGTYVKHNL